VPSEELTSIPYSLPQPGQGNPEEALEKISSECSLFIANPGTKGIPSHSFLNSEHRE
jgi:hypothetical protein